MRDRLRALGARPVVIDTGILGEPAGCTADVTRAEVAAADGDDLEAVRAAGSRGAAVERMLAGVRAVCLRLYAAGELDGALCLGGAEGAIMGAGRDARAARRRAEADRLAERLGPARVRAVHGGDRHDGDALRRRHPRPARDLARDLRQRRRRGRRDGARGRRSGRRAGRAHRRRDDARPDDAGRDAAARAAARGRARAGRVPRQRRRRPGDGEARRDRRARRRRRLHALRARQLAARRRPRDRPGAAARRRPPRPAAGRRARLLRLLQPGRARHRAGALSASARATSTTPSPRSCGSRRTRASSWGG